MRLLLDEHYPLEICELLRARGHDVICVAERKDLAGNRDEDLVNAATAETRAIVTENAKHFVPLATAKIIQGEGHHGLILTAASSLPSRKDAIGSFVTRLSTLLEQNPAPDAFLNRIHWLN